MAGWYGPTERGAVMGFWSTCFQAGPLAATTLAAWLLAHFGWRTSFFVPGVWVALIDLLVLLFLEEQPREAARAQPEPGARSPQPEGSPQPQSVLRNPVVWLLGAAYFGMKLIRYCLDFWLPYYLERSLGYPRDTAAYVSTG